MKVCVYPVLSKMPEDRFYGKTVVVVHVLRSVTAMIWAMRNGAQKIVPVHDAAEAVEMAGRLSLPDCIMAGEQNGKMPSGFTLSGSPQSYTEAVVKNRTIIISTSNGSSAVTNTGSAKHVLLGAMINRTAVAKRMLEYSDDAVVICAGSGGEASADDLICAGAVLNALQNLAIKAGIRIEETDMAVVCRTLFRCWKTKELDISSLKAVRSLMSCGYKNDVDFCLTADLTDVVPEYANGIIQ